MNTLLLLRSHLGVAIALGAVLLIALALTALRFDFPGEIPGLELLLFGWLGVALGRLAIGSRASESDAAGGSTGASENSTTSCAPSPDCSSRILAKRRLFPSVCRAPATVWRSTSPQEQSTTS